MENVKGFKESIRKASSIFKNIPNTEKIKVISHLDSDGITAASIILNALNRANYQHSVSIMQQLDHAGLMDAIEDNINTYVFTDLGSGQISVILDLLKNKNVFILDHHEIEQEKINSLPDNFVFVNPHLFGIDGSSQISGAGVTYFFCVELDKKNKDMAHIAIVGLIGDIQDKKGLSDLNKEILKDAVSQNIIHVEKDLNLYGKTRPLYKALEYTSDPFIPGVSNSESGAIQFLIQSGINPKTETGKWKTIGDLTKQEKQRLAAGMIMKRSNEADPENIFANQYTLLNETIPKLKDVREFSSLLNACGRLDNASIGIGVCLGDELKKRQAISNYEQYKKELVMALNWFRNNKNNPEKITTKDGYMIMNAGNEVLHSIIGTMSSMISKGNSIKPGTLILSLAKMQRDKTKVSLRYCGIRNPLNLKEVVSRIVEKAGGEAGGHKDAAGAIINSADENIFIKTAEQEFSKLK